jgi:hypothetical protein
MSTFQLLLPVRVINLVSECVHTSVPEALASMAELPQRWNPGPSLGFLGQVDLGVVFVEMEQAVPDRQPPAWYITVEVSHENLKVLISWCPNQVWSSLNLRHAVDIVMKAKTDWRKIAISNKAWVTSRLHDRVENRQAEIRDLERSDQRIPRSEKDHRKFAIIGCTICIQRQE